MNFSRRDKFEIVLFIVIAILFAWLVVTRASTIHNNIQEQERQEKIWREEYEAHR
jgi:uncharacterized membrane protein